MIDALRVHFADLERAGTTPCPVPVRAALGRSAREHRVRADARQIVSLEFRLRAETNRLKPELQRIGECEAKAKLHSRQAGLTSLNSRGPASLQDSHREEETAQAEDDQARRFRDSGHVAAGDLSPTTPHCPRPEYVSCPRPSCDRPRSRYREGRSSAGHWCRHTRSRTWNDLTPG